MSAADIATLMGMGATRSQAVKALSKHKEVMEAAEAIFADEEGSDVEEEEQDSDEGEDSYYDDIDILSDSDEKVDFDPYKGIDMSKDRIKTVVELEQVPRTITIKLNGKEHNVQQMTQGQWMQGCPEGSEQSHLFAVYQQLGETKCPSCKTPLQQKNGGLLLLFESVQDYFEYVKKNARTNCTKCNTQSICIACSTANDMQVDEPSKSSKSKQEEVEEFTNMFHCGELQAVLVGVGLAHIQELLEEPTKRSASEEKDAANKKTKHTLAGKAVRSGAPDKGTGYAGDAIEHREWHTEHKQKQVKQGQLMQKALEQVRYYLPNINRATPASSDFMPHIATIAQIRRRLLPVVSRLLQSDSLADMSERYDLYHEVMAEWFRAFASNEALVPLLAQPIFLPTKTEYKIQKDKSREKHVTYKGSSGPRELAQSIVAQCNDFLVNLNRHNQYMFKEVEEDDSPGIANVEKKKEEIVIEEGWAAEEQKLCHFAQSFVDEVAAIDRTLRMTKGDAFINKLLGQLEEKKEAQTAAVVTAAISGTREDTAEEIAAYEAWAKTQCYDESDMTQTKAEGKSTYQHVFDAKIQTTDGGSNHKRGFTIAKELAGLRVSLPSAWNGSIFLRVDESRIDVLKACIVGPEGSPYQNGLFMFDIYLPSSYNHTSPEVKIVTTARGTVRHNPNLYADGKVCLSLLGTWQGPGWISGQSTLLQVLISIQSLVMGVEEPALNEPGWSNWSGRPESIAYTKNCRRQTVAVAILNHIKEPDPIWKDVIEGHFRLKANSLSRQLDKWLSQDDGKGNRGDGSELMSTYHPSFARSEEQQGASQSKFARDITTIKELLRQH